METNLYARLKRATPNIMWQRHEDRYAKGIPDCSYVAPDTMGWVELKTYDGWNRQFGLCWSDLRPEQINWLTSRARVCGNVYIMLEVKLKGGCDLFLLPCVFLRDYKQATRPQLLKYALWFGYSFDSELENVLCNRTQKVLL